jgi:hypothetical protein
MGEAFLVGTIFPNSILLAAEPSKRVHLPEQTSNIVSPMQTDGVSAGWVKSTLSRCQSLEEYTQSNTSAVSHIEGNFQSPPGDAFAAALAAAKLMHTGACTVVAPGVDGLVYCVCCLATVLPVWPFQWRMYISLLSVPAGVLIVFNTLVIIIKLIFG